MPRTPKGGYQPHRWRGRWRAAFDTGRDALGARKRRWVYGKSEAECWQKFRALARDLEDGLPVDPAQMSVAQWLDEWLETKSHEVKEGTVTNYREDLRHMRKKLGAVRLDKLTPLQVQKAQQWIDKNVGTRTARYARDTLNNSLRDAVALEVLARNPVEKVKAVRYRPPEYEIWQADEIGRFLAASAGSWYHAFFYLGLTSGLRPGELIALHWQDLSGDTLHVRRTITKSRAKKRVLGKMPKTDAGNRLVVIPEDAVAVLADWRATLAAQGLGAAPLALPSRSGTLPQGENVQRSLDGYAKRAGVKRIRLHDLRHTHASMMIAAGMTAVELARRLGHTNAAFTYRKYAHFFERYQSKAVPTLGELLGRGES